MVRTLRSKPTEFRLYAPSAKKVFLVGSFNNWNAKKAAAKKDSRGTWRAKISLKPGRHEYKFLVDGQWWNDPACTTFISNSFGSQNCVMDVK
jgi:1,4-alpha-glucan branching enzyme